MKGAIYHPPTYFDNCYEDEWLTTPLAKEMIRDVDRSEVISAHLIDSPVLGPIPPKDLSGGIKTLLLTERSLMPPYVEIIVQNGF